MKNEHTEGTLVGDAFVIYAGLDETPPETSWRSTASRGLPRVRPRTRRGRASSPSPTRAAAVVGAKTLRLHTVGAAPTEEDREPLHPYVYKRETACGIIMDVDDRCYERGTSA